LHPDVLVPHEAAFEFHDNAFSHCSRKTRLQMAELGIPFVHKPIDLIETGSYQTLSPACLKVSPSGLIPTLVHNGHPVYESDDIMAYAVSQAAHGAEADTLRQTRPVDGAKWTALHASPSGPD